MSPKLSYRQREFWLHVRGGLIGSIRARLSEWGLSLLMINWGWDIMFSSNRFFDPPYDGWGNLFDPYTLGISMILIGIIRLIILVINGSYRRSPHLRVLFSLLSGMTWFFLWISLLQASDVPPTVPVVYKWLSIIDFFAMLRSANDARIEDDKHKEG